MWLVRPLGFTKPKQRQIVATIIIILDLVVLAENRCEFAPISCSKYRSAIMDLVENCTNSKASILYQQKPSKKGCLVLVLVKRDWHAANAICRSAGGRLLWLKDRLWSTRSANQLLIPKLIEGQQQLTSFWIGLRFVDSQWQWVCASKRPTETKARLSTTTNCSRANAQTAAAKTPTGIQCTPMQRPMPFVCELRLQSRMGLRKKRALTSAKPLMSTEHQSADFTNTTSVAHDSSVVPTTPAGVLTGLLVIMICIVVCGAGLMLIMGLSMCPGKKKKHGHASKGSDSPSLSPGSADRMDAFLSKHINQTADSPKSKETKTPSERIAPDVKVATESVTARHHISSLSADSAKMDHIPTTTTTITTTNMTDYTNIGNAEVGTTTKTKPESGSASGPASGHGYGKVSGPESVELE